MDEIRTPDETPNDVPQETPMTSEGFGLSTDLASHVAEPTSTSTRGSFEAAVSGFKFDRLNMEELKDRGLKLATSLESQAKANPLLLAGVVGFGALAAGYVLGRVMRPAPQQPSMSFQQRPERFPAYTD